MRSRFLRSSALAALLALAAAAPCAAAEPSPPVEVLLERAGERMQDFFREETGVSSIERVEQTKRNGRGQTVSQKSAEYEYLVLLQLAGNDLLTQETRELRGNADKKPSQPLLLTKGFSLLGLILHPHFQSSFLFALSPGEAGNDAGATVLKFTRVPGSRSPSVLALRGKHYPIPWKGSVWLDNESGVVRRVRAELGDSLSDLGLQALSADVAYGPVSFENPARVFWLPMHATVEARTEHQHWRNVHTYSNYKRFEVSTTIDVIGPKENDRKPDTH